MSKSYFINRTGFQKSELASMADLIHYNKCTSKNAKTNRKPVYLGLSERKTKQKLLVKRNFNLLQTVRQRSSLEGALQNFRVRTVAFFFTVETESERVIKCHAMVEGELEPLLFFFSV